MALGDAYLTTAEFKTRIRSESAANDAAIAAVLLSASRSIDGYCGREFNKSAAPESRVFECAYTYWGNPVHPVTFVDEYPYGGAGACLATGDLVSVTSIASGDGTGAYPTIWDADSYALLPRNAAAKGFPYTEIGPPVGRWSGWPGTSYGVQVTGIFGWPAVPAPVKEACFLIANRLKSLWDAPFGQSGGGEMGSLDMTVSITPIVAGMLNPYVVRTV
jgi:hypothetical protein